MTMSDLESKMWTKNYVWRMASSKSRIKPETKARMRQEFEDAVLEYADAIAHGREEAEKMAEYNAGLMR